MKNASKTTRVFFKDLCQKLLFWLFLHLNRKVKRAIVKMQSVCEYFVHEETSEWVRVFYWREKNCKSEYFCWFLRASKIKRGFSARAIKNFGDKKAIKTAIFGIEKGEEKKTFGGGNHQLRKNYFV